MSLRTSVHEPAQKPGRSAVTWTGRPAGDSSVHARAAPGRGDGRVGGRAEEVLHPHRRPSAGRRRSRRRRVRPLGHGHAGGHEAVELGHPVVADELAAARGPRRPLEVGPAGGAGQQRGASQSSSDAEERVVGQVGPAAAEAPPTWAKATRAWRARAASVHRSTASRVAADLVEEGRGGGRARARRAPGVAEDERAEAAFGPRPQVVAVGVPGQGVDPLDDGAGGGHRLDVGLVEGGGHADAEVASPASAELRPRRRARPRRGTARRQGVAGGHQAPPPLRSRNRPPPRAWAIRSG